MRLRRELVSFRLRESFSGLLIKGFPVDDDAVGPTPESWGAATRRTALYEVVFLLCGSLLGDPIAWELQQDGAIVHDVLPIKGHEELQINSASSADIWWHTEEAFHALRADYVGLMCLRNPDRVSTTIAAIDDVRLDPETVSTLMRSQYIILPDQSHKTDPLNSDPLNGEPLSGEAGGAKPDGPGTSIDRMRHDPERIPVLFGDPRAPYIRIDPYYMPLADLGEQGDAAVRQLTKAINLAIREVSLGAGDLLFVDNYRAVHGRRSFGARYDGKDRWLKRLNLTRDLRKSRSSRASAIDRAIS